MDVGRPHLETAGIYDDVTSTRLGIEYQNTDVCGAILELFYPYTNTFIAPNVELCISLRKMKQVFGFPVYRSCLKKLFLQMRI